MLKRCVIFLLFLALLPLVVIRSQELRLNYYVLSSFLIFPIYGLYLQSDRFFLFTSAGLFILAHSYFMLSSPGWAMFVLVAAQLGILGALVFYHERWKRRLSEEESRNAGMLDEREGLKRKYDHRLESLHGLEKQVSSLMDLFEIARDFSDCMNYESLTDLLHKKVMPELPFQRMRLILTKEEQGEPVVYRSHVITADTKETLEGKLAPEETLIGPLMRRASESKRLERQDSCWLFPLIQDKQIIGFLSVEGAAQTDLTKFEVLAAHLVLQIRKIQLYETVLELSIVDSLTQVFVRRHFMELFDSELKRSVRQRLSLALLMLDIDHFKRYNDEFGHLVGDATLREVAAILRSNLRKVDVVARYGGEEFIMLMPETGLEGAQEVAERIRSGMARNIFKAYHIKTRVTVSIGIAMFPGPKQMEWPQDIPKELASDLIQKADKALYQAKEEGRNRVILFHP